MRNRLKAIGAALAFWTFLALVFTPQTYIMNLRAPKPLEWWQAFASDALLFYLWAALRRSFSGSANVSARTSALAA
jgi:hypothetical protein